MDMCEYDAGQCLTVKYTPTSTRATPPSPELDLHLGILHAFKPFTMSVVCHVRISSPSSLPLPSDLPLTCVVKLFDRRYASNYRKASFDHPARPYSAAREDAYQQRLLDGPEGQSSGFDEDGVPDESDWGAMEEAFERSCNLMYSSEVRAYEELRELQGTLVPMLYGTVRHDSPVPPPVNVGDAPSPHRYAAHGILLEYIPSSTLAEHLRTSMQAEPIPYDIIAEVCDQAIGVMDGIDDFNVLNDDVRLENILVAPLGMSHDVLY